MHGLGHYTLDIAGALADQSLGANGTALGAVSACGISPSLRGDASALGGASGSVTFTGVATRVARPPADLARGVEVHKKHCLQLNITSMAVPSLSVDLHDISVHIDLGILHIPISYFVDLFKGTIKQYLTSYLQSELPQELPEYINDDLPCVPVI